MKILIAEDDKTYRQLLSGLLKKWGHEPVTAVDGDEAWEILSQPGAPRIALIDWVMPGVNGLDLCRRIRSRNSAEYTHVVILTGKSQPGDAIVALEAGADDFVVKPFHPNELRARIRALQRILELEQDMVRRAQHDYLTGLPNRSLLVERFNEGLARTEQARNNLGLFYINFDRLRLINDALGHAAGDALIMESAARLATAAGPGRTLARIGGDDFVLLAPELRAPDEAREIAEALLATLEGVIETGKYRMYSSAGVGIALYPRDGRNLDTLLQNAGAAMFAAKRSGRNAYTFFEREMSERSSTRLEMEGRIRGALQREEFFLQYQPVYRCADKSFSGAEALLRWRDPVKGMISPATFIPVAEEGGHILKIGTWVLDRACRQASAWAASGGPPFRVAVNISANQLSEDDLISTVEKTLLRTGVNPRLIELELTETAVAHDLAKSGATIQALREMGVHVALDDFGTGFSSLSYLTNLAADTLKIDRSFLTGLDTDPRRRCVLESMTKLAHNLGMRVTVEGVEEQWQFDMVEEAGCDEIQGFLLARPNLPECIVPGLGVLTSDLLPLHSALVRPASAHDLVRAR